MQYERFSQIANGEYRFSVHINHLDLYKKTSRINGVKFVDITNELLIFLFMNLINFYISLICKLVSFKAISQTYFVHNGQICMTNNRMYK